MRDVLLLLFFFYPLPPTLLLSSSLPLFFPCCVTLDDCCMMEVRVLKYIYINPLNYTFSRDEMCVSKRCRRQHPHKFLKFGLVGGEFAFVFGRVCALS